MLLCLTSLDSECQELHTRLRVGLPSEQGTSLHQPAGLARSKGEFVSRQGVSSTLDPQPGTFT